MPLLQYGEHFLIDPIAYRNQNLLLYDISGDIDCDFDYDIAGNSGRKLIAADVWIRKLEWKRGKGACSRHRTNIGIAIL